MALDTSSEISIGPGMSKVGCSACFDMFADFAEALEKERVTFGRDVERMRGVYGRESSAGEICRSVE